MLGKERFQSPATMFTNGTFRDGGMAPTANKAALSRTTGKVLITCPVCYLDVLKPAAWVRRPGRSNFFCGHGCANEFKRIRVETACVVCEKKFWVTPSNKERLVTCGYECSCLHKTGIVIGQHEAAGRAVSEAVKLALESKRLHRLQSSAGAA